MLFHIQYYSMFLLQNRYSKICDVFLLMDPPRKDLPKQEICALQEDGKWTFTVEVKWTSVVLTSNN
jgi:hypothetical protein